MTRRQRWEGFFQNSPDMSITKMYIKLVEYQYVKASIDGLWWRLWTARWWLRRRLFWLICWTWSFDETLQQSIISKVRISSQIQSGRFAKLDGPRNWTLPMANRFSKSDFWNLHQANWRVECVKTERLDFQLSSSFAPMTMSHPFWGPSTLDLVWYYIGLTNPFIDSLIFDPVK